MKIERIQHSNARNMRAGLVLPIAQAAPPVYRHARRNENFVLIVPGRRAKAFWLLASEFWPPYPERISRAKPLLIQESHVD